MAGGSGGSGGGGGTGSAGIASGGASLLSIGLSAYSDVEKGDATQSADEFKAAQADQAAKFGRLQAGLTDTTMTEKLNTTLGNIDAIRAAGHIDPTSPTTAAVEQWQTDLSNRQRLAAVGTQRAQADADEASATYLRQSGQYAQQQGQFNAGLDIATGVAKTALAVALA